MIPNTPITGLTTEEMEQKYADAMNAAPESDHTPKGFQFAPSLEFAAKLNPMLAAQQRNGFIALYQNALRSYQGDTNRDQIVEGIDWEKLTFCQSAIVGFYAEKNAQADAVRSPKTPDLAGILKANAGPDAIWNYSYSQFGLDGSPLGSLLKVVIAATLGTGETVAVIVPANRSI